MEFFASKKVHLNAFTSCSLLQPIGSFSWHSHLSVYSQLSRCAVIFTLPCSLQALCSLSQQCLVFSPCEESCPPQRTLSDLSTDFQTPTNCKQPGAELRMAKFSLSFSELEQRMGIKRRNSQRKGKD